MWQASFFDFPANLKVYCTPRKTTSKFKLFKISRFGGVKGQTNRQTIQVIKHFTKDSFYNNLHILNTIWKIFFFGRGGGEEILNLLVKDPPPNKNHPLQKRPPAKKIGAPPIKKTVLPAHLRGVIRV